MLTAKQERFSLVCFLFGHKYFLIKKNDAWYVMSTNALRPLVKTMLDQISVGDDGLERVRSKIKIGSGKGKAFHKITQVIHIKPKKKREMPKFSYGERAIDFSIRFVRRGHWRDLDSGIGKNRAGDYCIDGRTWVNESKPIGPSDKPLIKKTRFVK